MHFLCKCIGRRDLLRFFAARGVFAALRGIFYLSVCTPPLLQSSLVYACRGRRRSAAVMGKPAGHPLSAGALRRQAAFAHRTSAADPARIFSKNSAGGALGGACRRAEGRIPGPLSQPAPTCPFVPPEIGSADALHWNRLTPPRLWIPMQTDRRSVPCISPTSFQKEKAPVSVPAPHGCSINSASPCKNCWTRTPAGYWLL